MQILDRRHKRKTDKNVRGLSPHLALITPSIFIISVLATSSCLAYVILEILGHARRLLIPHKWIRDGIETRDARSSSFFFAMIRSPDQVQVNGNNLARPENIFATSVTSNCPSMSTSGVVATFSPTFSPSFFLFLSFGV